MRAIRKESTPLTATVSEIIERDASEKLVRNVPVFDESDEVRVKFWNPFIKLFTSIEKYYPRGVRK